MTGGPTGPGPYGRHGPAAEGGRHGPAEEALDPDVDLHVPAQRAETAAGRAPLLLAVIAAGGGLGAAARYGLTLALPAHGTGFPWGIFLANAIGCAFIGALMALVSEGGRSTHRLVRPFLGVGLLGGFTTFSTYAVDSARLLGEGAGGTGLAYLGGTLVTALCAVWGGASAARAGLALRASRADRGDAPRTEDGERT